MGKISGTIALAIAKHLSGQKTGVGFKGNPDKIKKLKQSLQDMKDALEDLEVLKNTKVGTQGKTFKDILGI